MQFHDSHFLQKTALLEALLYFKRQMPHNFWTKVGNSDHSANTGNPWMIMLSKVNVPLLAGVVDFLNRLN